MFTTLIKPDSGTAVLVLLTTQYLKEADELADSIAVIDNGNVPLSVRKFQSLSSR